ncbi:MBL fold metallo-hydrolase [Candidatus Uhrbacteria bacterium]|nr:MBL fold metallo-hydrolase [Candidatus Uhrbacteria bacterium]
MKKIKKSFHKTAIKISASIAVAAFTLVGAYAGISAQNARQLTVSYFDVGQGDAELIRTPSSQNILIDGGPDRSVEQKLGSTLPFYDRTIDLMILTHPHADHLNGLIGVLQTYPVKKIFLSEMKNTTVGFREFLRIAKEKNIPIEYVTEGKRVTFGASTALDVLAPYDDEQSKTDINNASVVVKVTYHKTAFMFTGDAETTEEEHIARNRDDLASDVLKTGHHGSKTSTSEEFLAEVHPDIAIISVGKGNMYGHPDKEIIHRLEQNRITVYRTDEAGDITVKSDGAHVSVISQKNKK